MAIQIHGSITANLRIGVLLRDLLTDYPNGTPGSRPRHFTMQRVLDSTKSSNILLEQDSEVDEETEQYGNVLQATSIKKHVSVVTILIQNGADVNKRGGFFGSALSAACFSGSSKIVEWLIAAGALVQSQGFFGSPVDTLRESPNPSPDIMKQLLHIRTLRVAKVGLDTWVIRWAATSRYADVIQLIIEKMSISGKISFLWTKDEFRKKNHQSYQQEASYEAVYQ